MGESETGGATPWYRRTGPKLVLGGVALFGVGGAMGATIARYAAPVVQMAPTHATAIKDLAASAGVVMLRGKVAGVYGNSLLIEDATGRTLIETGRSRWWQAAPAAVGDQVATQGVWRSGTFRASFLVDAKGNVYPLRGQRGRGHGGHGRGIDAAQPVAPAPATTATPAPAGATPG